MRKLLLLLALILSCNLLNAQPATVVKSNPTKVYMHYMPWHDGPQNPAPGGTYSWGWHWTMNNKNPNIIDGSGKRQIASHFYPLIGPYESEDPHVIEYHLLLMKLSGIDGVLIDWYGSEGNNPDVAGLLTNSNALINRTGAVGVKFGLIMEDRFWGTIQNGRNSITYAKNNYFNKSNFIRHGATNSPLVGIFGPITYQTPAQWTDMLSYAGENVEFLPLWYESGDGGTNSDGEYAWIYSDYLTGLNNFYANRAPGLKTVMGVAYPGFHDFYVEGGAGSSYFNIPENNGATLNETLTKYDQYKANCDFLQLATFNDYGEGTIFEPTLENGFKYLVRIQQYTGVSYTENDLKSVHRLFTLRKKYLNDATKQGQLNTAFNHFVALRISDAVAMMNTVDGAATAAPVISSSGTASGTKGNAFSYTITASNNPTSRGATGLPAGLSVNTSTGVISGTPTATGTFNATITATNSGGTGSKTLTITINEPSSSAPVISSSGTASGVVGAVFSYTIAASNNPTSRGATGLPAGLSVNSSTGVISGTPTAAGTFNATITATNASGSGSKALVITITGSASSGTKYYIKNQWQNTYLYDAGDRAKYNATKSGTTYQWILEDVGGGLKELKNVGTGEYMHIENLTGYVQCTARTAGWGSSRWTTEDAGSGYVRFKNAWQSTQYIHVENLQGHAQYGAINAAWGSAKWLLEAVPAGARMSAEEDITIVEDNGIVYWPNPVVRDMTIQTDGSYNTLEVVDILGRSHHRNENIAGKTSINIDLAHIPAGINFIKLRGVKRTGIIRFLKK